MYPPAELNRVARPMLIAELGASVGNLAQVVDIPEQQFVGATYTLYELAVLAPVELRNERIVTLKGSLQSVGVAVNIVDVDIVVVRANGKAFLVRRVLEHFDPFL